MAREPRTLIELLYVRTGSFRDTAQVYRLIVLWSSAMRAHGGVDMAIEEVAEWGDPVIQSRATTHRQLQLFRKAFPGHREPNRLCRDFGLTAVEADPLIEVDATALV